MKNAGCRMNPFFRVHAAAPLVGMESGSDQTATDAGLLTKRRRLSLLAAFSAATL